jgi:hypothetical protein
MANGGDETLSSRPETRKRPTHFDVGVFVNSNNLSVQSGNLLGQAETGGALVVRPVHMH